MGGHPYLSKSTRVYYARNKSIADLGNGGLDRIGWGDELALDRGDYDLSLCFDG